MSVKKIDEVKSNPFRLFAEREAVTVTHECGASAVIMPMTPPHLAKWRQAQRNLALGCRWEGEEYKGTDVEAAEVFAEVSRDMCIRYVEELDGAEFCENHYDRLSYDGQAWLMRQLAQVSTPTEAEAEGL